jgi:hypothetical protein
MKNIVVIDIYAQLMKSILDTNLFNISLAVVDDVEIAEKCKEIKNLSKDIQFYYRFPKTNFEFYELNKSNYNLTYEVIEKFRPAQFKVERFLHRELEDEASIQERYFTALRHFLDFFENNKIDCIISAHVEHGAIWDSLIFEIAKSKNIPVYIISIVSSSGNEEINNIIRMNDNKICSLEQITSRKQMDFDIFFKNLNKYFSAYKAKKKNFTLPFKIKFSEKICFMLCNLKSMLNLHKIRMDNNFKTQITLNKIEKIQKQLYINYLFKTYESLSTQPNYNEKYILYPLHQEPEASFMIRATMNSQLYIIKLISENLPDGWKLYVKEHPSQFYGYYNAEYFYKNIEYYRSTDFYTRIKSFKNVELISINTPISKLEMNAKAITSITGTCLLEGIFLNKPIIIWGNGCNTVEKLNDVFVIRKIDDLKQAIYSIEKDFKPSYNDFKEIFNKYTFSSEIYGLHPLCESNELYKEIISKICTKSLEEEC